MTNVPNWQHHSKKEQKRHLKPQAMRAARERLRQFKKRYTKPSGDPRGSYSIWVLTEIQ